MLNEGGKDVCCAVFLLIPLSSSSSFRSSFCVNTALSSYVNASCSSSFSSSSSTSSWCLTFSSSSSTGEIVEDYELEREKTNRLQSEMDTAFSELAEM